MSYAIQINLSMETDNYEEFLTFVEQRYQDIFEDLTDGKMSKKVSERMLVAASGLPTASKQM